MARFLFLTIQQFESDFYGSVGRELEQLGHEAAHVTVSRRSARRLRARGLQAHCLLDELGAPPADLHAAGAAAEAEFAVDVADAVRTDSASSQLSAAAATTRALRWLHALDRLIQRIAPDVLVPEVGAELPRTLAHAIGLRRSIPTFFLFYTIFPNPLRLYVDTMHAPIVPLDALRPLEPHEQEEVRSFVESFTRRRSAIRTHRRLGLTPRRLRNASSYVLARLWEDRGNEYLRPGRWARDYATEFARRLAARRYYASVPTGRFLYFPLHVVDDYKIARVIPHLSDQLGVVRALAAAAPAGVEVVVKEHPLSIGRNDLSLLRALRDTPNVRVVHPEVSSHDLIRDADGVVVLSSTVGLEALLYERPVLTLGEPFYAGYGVTVDITRVDELAAAVPRLLSFRPDPARLEELLHAAMRACSPGAPVLVDRSPGNARVLAHSLASAAA